MEKIKINPDLQIQITSVIVEAFAFDGDGRRLAGKRIITLTPEDLQNVGAELIQACANNYSKNTKPENTND